MPNPDAYIHSDLSPAYHTAECGPFPASDELGDVVPGEEKEMAMLCGAFKPYSHSEVRKCHARRDNAGCRRVIGTIREVINDRTGALSVSYATYSRYNAEDIKTVSCGRCGVIVCGKCAVTVESGYRRDNKFRGCRKCSQRRSEQGDY